MMSISNIHWITLPIGMVLSACSQDGGLVQPPEEPSPIPTAIALVSGNNQEGKTLEHLGEPFVVRVTDAHGDGVENVAVTWSVTSGDGDFSTRNGWAPEAKTFTDADGFARSSFRPKMLGTSTATARAEGLPGSSAVFRTEATVLVIWAGYWYGIGFGPEDVRVPEGTTIEWLNVYDYSPPHTVTSSSAPTGGSSFDSGLLNPGDRFQFVAEVVGTWGYFCAIHGADQESGAITAG